LKAPRRMNYHIWCLSALIFLGALAQSKDEGIWTLHIDNCLQQMTLQSCRDVEGNWLIKPNTTIPQYERGVLQMSFPLTTKQIQANCTYTYTNSRGTHQAFVDWQFSFFGQQSLGAGTADSADGEQTELSDPAGTLVKPLNCVWFFYASEGEMDCVYRTNETLCHPQDFRPLQTKLGTPGK